MQGGHRRANGRGAEEEHEGELNVACNEMLIMVGLAANARFELIHAHLRMSPCTRTSYCVGLCPIVSGPHVSGRAVRYSTHADIRVYASHSESLVFQKKIGSRIKIRIRVQRGPRRPCSLVVFCAVFDTLIRFRLRMPNLRGF